MRERISGASTYWQTTTEFRASYMLSYALSYDWQGLKTDNSVINIRPNDDERLKGLK